MNKPTKLLLSLCATTLLAACQTNSATQDTSVNAAIERARSSAAYNSGTSGSLSYLEGKYKRESNNAQNAISYANALRKNEYLNRAELVLAPFANDPESPAEAKSEYAALQLAMGNYKSAEKYAQKAIIQDDTNFNAYHHLGIALDAQGMHEEAERAFRKGLDHWQGDPTSIMNNLALNLASQNLLEESMEILKKAESIAPNRPEIERNLRIVTALQQSTGIKAPKPAPKPNRAE